MSTVPARPAGIPFAVCETANAACAAVARREGRSRAFLWAPARHASSRFGYGATTGAAAAHFDADGWWRTQVSLGKNQPGYAAIGGLTTALPTLSMNAVQTSGWLKRSSGNTLAWTAMQQLTSATLLLQAYSPAQLYESLVDFFANHLNVSNFYDAAASSRATFDRDTIRAHVFGRYRDMLRASARDVTMQRFLTLSQSTARALNENYGRELLELHTVTPAAGYGQAEVVSSARIMTGRFHDLDSTYEYVAGRHWTGPVKVLNFTSANATGAGGEKVGDAYLAYLAAHPMTARNLARKLCVRFVSDTPSNALINAVARAYLANDTAILPAVSVIFRSTEFWAMHGAKLRRPAENVVATVRALGLRPSTNLAATGAALTQLCSAAGQVPLSWPAPDGYPDTAAAWRSAGAVTSAWAVQYDLVTGSHAAAFRSWNPARLLAGRAPRTAGDVLDRLAANVLGTPLTGKQKSALLDYLGERSGTPIHSSGATGPHLRELIALLLHSPQHAQR